jgi:hypothetical protein
MGRRALLRVTGVARRLDTYVRRLATDNAEAGT